MMQYLKRKEESMKRFTVLRLLLTLLFAGATHCLTLTGPSSAAVEQGGTEILECSVEGVTMPIFQWTDQSVNPIQTIFTAGSSFSTSTKYTDNFGISEDANSSNMTITTIAIEDEGEYICASSGGPAPALPAVITVEVAGTAPVISLSPTTLVAGQSYTAQCEVIGSRPQVGIDWDIDGNELTTDDDTISPNADPNLFDTVSVLTFTPVRENNEALLRCSITGHSVISLNVKDSTALDVHYAPGAVTVTVEITDNGLELEVTCSILAGDDGNPSVSNYYIYANDTFIGEGTSVNTVQTDKPDSITVFKCVAGNYLGNVTATAQYDPQSAGPNIGAIVGGVIGGIVVVLLIAGVVYYLCVYKQKGNKSSWGGSANSGNGGNKSPKKSKKSSGKGSSVNDSQQESVEVPLKSVPVVTQQSQPTASPRSSSIQHTTNNPNQDMYAVVSKPPGGDQPDTGRSGKGQSTKNEPVGTHYAELDLSPQAGHTEERIPQDKDGVVVYSSILV